MTAEGRRNNLNIRLVTVEELSHIKDIKKPDAIISRVINPALSKRLEDAGLKVFNSADVSELCNNKAETINRVHKLGNIHIPTIIVSAIPYINDSAYSYECIKSPFLSEYNKMLDKLTYDKLDSVFLNKPIKDIDLSKYVIKSVT